MNPVFGYLNNFCNNEIAKIFYKHGNNEIYGHKYTDTGQILSTEIAIRTYWTFHIWYRQETQERVHVMLTFGWIPNLEQAAGHRVFKHRNSLNNFDLWRHYSLVNAASAPNSFRYYPVVTYLLWRLILLYYY